jgi:acyl-CoA thioesterase-1
VVAAVAARALCLCILGLWLLDTAQAGAQSRTILVFGDSLSAAYGFDIEKGWVSLLQRRLDDHNPPYTVVNASISGETTRGGAARIESTLAAQRPRVVLVELGGNDGLRGIGVENTRQNLERIIDASIAAGAEVLLLAIELPPNYGQSYTAAFRGIYQSLGHRQGVTLVPFFLDGVAGDATLMQSDGIHPQAEAQPKLLENVWPYLEPMLDN